MSLDSFLIEREPSGELRDPSNYSGVAAPSRSRGPAAHVFRFAPAADGQAARDAWEGKWYKNS